MADPLCITRRALAALVARRNEALAPAQRFTLVPIAWADVCADALEAVRVEAALSTPLRVQQFIAQLAHETGGFRKLVESVAYTNAERLAALFSNVHGLDHARRLIAEGPRAIACCIYASKLGNGPVESGDGFRYRGRGFIMNTGKANYAAVQRYSKLPVVDDPDLLGEPVAAAKAAAAFWTTRHLNAAADAGDTDEVTRAVNGPAMQGKAERRLWASAAALVWPDERDGAEQ